MDETPTETYSTAEAMAALDCGRSTLYRWRAAKLLRSVTVRNRARWSRRDVDALAKWHRDKVASLAS